VRDFTTEEIDLRIKSAEKRLKTLKQLEAPANIIANEEKLIKDWKDRNQAKLN
jgi:hypothetical protein